MDNQDDLMRKNVDEEAALNNKAKENGKSIKFRILIVISTINFNLDDQPGKKLDELIDFFDQPRFNETMDSSDDEYRLNIDESTKTTDQNFTQVEEKREKVCGNNEIKEKDIRKTESLQAEPNEAIKTDESEGIAAPTLSPKKRVTSALNSAFQMIKKREKRRAFLRNLSRETKEKTIQQFALLSVRRKFKPKPIVEIAPIVDKSNEVTNSCFAVASSSFNSTPTNKLNLSSFDNKLEKYGTTVKKVKATEKIQSFPVTADEESTAMFQEPQKLSFRKMPSHKPLPIKPADQPSSPNKMVLMYPPNSTRVSLVRPGFKRGEATKMVQVLHHSRANPPFTRVFNRVIKVKPSSEPSTSDIKPGSSILALTDRTAEVSASRFKLSPWVSKFGGNQIRLQKDPNGAYKFISTSKESIQFPPPDSFPKAIVYSDYNKQTVVHPNAIKYPSSSAQASSSTVVQPNEIKYPSSPAQASSSTASNPRMVCKDPTNSRLDRPRPLPHEVPREKSPEPVKYIIPQDLLDSKTDKIKIAHIGSEDLETKVSNNQDENDLFVIDNEPEEEKKPQPEAMLLNKRRRKSTLIPKTDEDENMFEEPLFQPPPRPQDNIDLIENLAKYRALVSTLLEKLNLPYIDLNEDGDEYINMYKIFKT